MAGATLELRGEIPGLDVFPAKYCASDRAGEATD